MTGHSERVIKNYFLLKRFKAILNFFWLCSKFLVIHKTIVPTILMFSQIGFVYCLVNAGIIGVIFFQEFEFAVVYCNVRRKPGYR